MHRMMWSNTAALASLTLVMTLSGCRPDGATPTQPGKALYAACQNCHGLDGAGNTKLAAPAIAGLPQWYVERQLDKFRTGIRGAHPDDLEGLRMRPMSRQMKTEDEVRAVAAYVAAMPKKVADPSVEGGDAAAGAASYAVCLACHGADGKGNQQMNAPPLVGQHDWYLVAQLKKFKGGLRGANPKDITGGQMRPMSMTLADEQAMKNVVAHIQTLGK
jgi:cytochrome c553